MGRLVKYVMFFLLLTAFSNAAVSESSCGSSFKDWLLQFDKRAPNYSGFEYYFNSEEAGNGTVVTKKVLNNLYLLTYSFNKGSSGVFWISTDLENKELSLAHINEGAEFNKLFFTGKLNESNTCNAELYLEERKVISIRLADKLYIDFISEENDIGSFRFN